MSFTVITEPFSTYLTGSGGDGEGQSFVGNVADVQPGDILACRVVYAGAETTVTASDGAASTWAQTDEVVDSNQRVSWIYTLATAASGSPTLNITLGAARAERRCQWWHIRPSETPVFGGFTGNNGSGTAASSGNLAVSGSDCFVLGSCDTWNVLSASGSARAINGVAPDYDLGNTNHYSNSFARAVSEGFTGAATTTLASTDAWIATILYFRIGEGGSEPEQVTIDSVSDLTLEDGQTGIEITGAAFGASQGSGKVIISPTDDVEDPDAVEQTVTSWGDTSITFTAVREDLPFGETLYLFVINDDGDSNESGEAISFVAARGKLIFSGSNRFFDKDGEPVNAEGLTFFVWRASRPDGNADEIITDVEIVDGELELEIEVATLEDEEETSWFVFDPDDENSPLFSAGVTAVALE